MSPTWVVGETSASNIASHEPQLMFDDSVQTSWIVQGAQPGAPQWVVLDLGADARLSKLKLYKDSVGGIEHGELQCGKSPAGPWRHVCNIATTNDQQWQQVVKAFTPQTSRYWRLSVSQLWPHSGESVEICELNFFGYMLPTPTYMHSASHKSAQAASATTSNGLLGTMESAWGGGPQAHNVAVYGILLLCVVGFALRYTVFASPRHNQEYSQVVEMEDNGSGANSDGIRSGVEHDDDTEDDVPAAHEEEQPLSQEGSGKNGSKVNPFASEYRT
eukprot:g765.t1